MRPLTIILSLLLTLLAAIAEADGRRAGEFDYYVLALSWQPAFCEFHRSKPECKTQTARDFSASHFVLHGLWPNRESDDRHRYTYCGVDATKRRIDKQGKRCAIENISVDKDLQQSMPGTQSCLHIHEWLKHGSCSGLDRKHYFTFSQNLVEQMATTRITALVQANIGTTMARRQLISSWVEEFGDEAAKPVLLCHQSKGKQYLTEIRITLRRDATRMVRLSSMLLHDHLRTQSTCGDKMHIDAVGYQE